MTTKIATCCYCGTRTALTLTARHGHELACGRCGAPLARDEGAETGQAALRAPDVRGTPDAARNPVG